MRILWAPAVLITHGTVSVSAFVSIVDHGLFQESSRCQRRRRLKRSLNGRRVRRVSLHRQHRQHPLQMISYDSLLQAFPLVVPLTFSLNPDAIGVYQPLIFSLLAGLSTCLGAAVVFFADQSSKPFSERQLAFSLSLAASVMVTVSFFSILPESFRNEETQRMLSIVSPEFWERCVSMSIGCGLYLLLSKFAFPEPEAILQLEPDDTVESSASKGIAAKRTLGSVSPLALFAGSDLADAEARRSWRMAMLLFVSLAVHNFPEGLAVAASTMHSQRLGVTTTIAIALHNIPEGIAIAIPSLAARPNSPWLAFGLASLSGLAEPLGAAVAVAFLSQHQHGNVGANVDAMDALWNMHNILAFVAGIMVTVAVAELAPEAVRHSEGEHKSLVLGSLTGMAVMVASESCLT